MAGKNCKPLDLTAFVVIKYTSVAMCGWGRTRAVRSSEAGDPADIEKYQAAIRQKDPSRCGRKRSERSK